MLRWLSLGATILILSSPSARAQAPVTAAQPPPSSARPPAAPAQPPPVSETTISDRREATNDQKDWHFVGHVEMDNGADSKLYAEDVMYYEDGNRAIATGNVLLSQGDNRISAERAEFNTETRLGTFYNAYGLSTIKPSTQPARPGAIAPPPVAGQQTVVYFFGKKIEKIGPRKYRITDGGFTTCVQPTPRWDLSADTVVLNVDHYTLLKQAVLTVKGVPLLYLPIMYYPTKRDGRATGFLIPTYGSSSLRGQSIHDAFFWAIDRSDDATIFHDWFSKVGQGVGAEYRYNYGAGTNGSLRTYLLNQHDSTYVAGDGSTTVLPASRSFEVRGGANQLLPGNIRARANVDYFSSLETMQTFNTNIYDASRNQRDVGANLVGAWGTYSMNATVDHREYFYDRNNSVLSGSWPQIAFARNERPLFGSPVYVSLGASYASLLRDSHSVDTDGNPVESNQGLSRLDFAPQARIPFTRWQWLTVNSTVSWRDTYYSRSYVLDPTGQHVNDPATNQYAIADASVSRRYFSFQSQILGPVFNRIWDTPGNRYAEKFKHSIEPYLTIQRTSSIDNFNRIVQFDGTDGVVGGTTQYTYGVNNRLYAKRSASPGQPAQAREIVDVQLSQTYYTNSLASQFDQRYATSFTGAPPSNFSPLALDVRALPSNDINASVHAEFDSKYRTLRTISATASYSIANLLQTTLGWSKKAFIPELAGFNDRNFLDHYVNGTANLHTRDNRFGGLYSFNYDVLRSNLQQQRMTGFYNAQCCGIAFEYQTYNFGAGSFSPIPADHRFFLSFTLAGLGNFSPFNGALSGVPH